MTRKNRPTGRLLACVLASALVAPAAWSQPAAMDHGSMNHGAAPAPAPADHGSMPGMDHGSMNHGEADGGAPAAPPVGSLPASDGAGERGYDSYGIHPHMMDNAPTWQVLFDKFGLARNRDGQNTQEWDGRFWFGTATDRFLIKSEGERENGGGSGGKVEAFWSHAVSPFWDLQLGARRDIGSGPKRNWAAIGIEGVLPYNIELEATGYAGSSGRAALALKAEYDLLLTQRLIFTPELEASLYGKDDPERGIGSGLSDGSLSLRLRYEVTREFAPYIGVSFERKFGQTARYASDAGASRSQTAIMAGVRFWF
ncbi:Copper resistance protein B precursor [Achromobacter denitrificans]|uniref:copper resistance protein B n=1 Tax=Achromobacter denitrificans TaxID=32002 RepID=UPI0007889BF5|nr:copper resistance protein B [Achromobacter denitrificans]QKH44645.1 copper resistance protein B [Achromobacter denitrificans]QKH48214.1 copper resistance protein B [Achromobacter denitrificans]CAB3679606.1 Copper resistance protein B [Achromobacter denitrificans]SUU04896.1 Copper resistance protein B precursor [Achromobacter denitrificans]